MKAPLMATWFGVVMLAAFVALLAVEEQQKRFRQWRIEWLIGRLDKDDVRVRERAGEELMAIGLPALEPLRQAIPDDAEPDDRRDRLQSIFDRVAIYQPGGEWANGMKLCLRADCDAVRPGDTFTLTTTLCNLDDQRMLLPGGSLKSFQDGRNLRRVPDSADPAALLELWPHRNAPPGRILGFSGIIDVGEDEIPVRSSRTFRMPATVIQENGRCLLQLGESRTRLLEVPASGIATFRMVYTNSSDSVEILLWISGNGQVDLKPVCWKGTARSNDVSIRILPPPPGYVPPPRPAVPPANQFQIQFVY